LTELTGKRIAIGNPGSGTEAVARKILTDNGIQADTAGLVNLGGAKSADALLAGGVDAAMFVTSVTSKLVRRLLAAPDIALMNFERADAYLRRNNFLSKVMLPKGAVDLAVNLPAEDTVLLAPAATIVASERLHPALVDLLQQAMFEVHAKGGHLEAEGKFPSNRFVTFPMNPSARRYIEEGPPFLQRYLPFWLANLVDRLKIMLLPLLTLMYPLFKILPPTYEWRIMSKVNRWYKEMETIEDAVREGELSNGEAARRLDEMNLAVEQISVPPSYAAATYDLRLHIKFLSRRFAADDS
jgi:hypothetical protein